MPAPPRAVTVLGTAPAALALLGDMAEQEGVYLALCVGRLEAAPSWPSASMPSCCTPVSARARPRARGGAPRRRGTARTWWHDRRRRGSPDREGAVTWPAAPADVATAGLVETARFACLPDHQAPEYLIAPPLLDHFLATLAPATWLVAPPTPAWLVFLRREDVQ